MRVNSTKLRDKLFVLVVPVYFFVDRPLAASRPKIVAPPTLAAFDGERTTTMGREGGASERRGRRERDRAPL